MFADLSPLSLPFICPESQSCQTEQLEYTETFVCSIYIQRTCISIIFGRMYSSSLHLQSDLHSRDMIFDHLCRDLQQIFSVSLCRRQ